MNKPLNLLPRLYFIDKLVQKIFLDIFPGVDLIGPLKEFEGKQYTATAVDYFTKFVEAKAM